MHGRTTAPADGAGPADAASGRPPERRGLRASHRSPRPSRRYRPGRAERAEVFANRVHRARGGHAHLRLRRLHGGRRPARHPGRAALLRPVHQHAHRLTAPRGWEVVRFEGEFAPPQHTIDDLTALAEAVREAGRADRPVEMPPRARPGPPRPPAGAAQRVRGLSHQRLNRRRPLRRPCGAPARVDCRDGHPCHHRSRRSSRRPVGSDQGLRRPRRRRRAARRRAGPRDRRGAGPAAARGVAGDRRRRGRLRHARQSSPELAAAFAEGVTGARPRRRRHRPGQHRHALLRLRRPRHARRDVHRQPQPRPLQRDQAVPGRRGADRRRTPAWPRSGRPSSRAFRRRRPGTGGGTVSKRDCSPTTPPTCAAWSTCPRPAAAGRRRRRQRHGRAHRAGGARRAAAGRRADVLRARRHLPEPRGQPAGPGQPGRPAEARGRRGRRHRAGLRRRRRPLLRRRRARRAGEPERDHRARRGPRAGQGPRQRRHPQPDHLAGRAGDRRRARRDAGAHPGRATRSSSR